MVIKQRLPIPTLSLQSRETAKKPPRSTREGLATSPGRLDSSNSLQIWDECCFGLGRAFGGLNHGFNEHGVTKL